MYLILELIIWVLYFSKCLIVLYFKKLLKFVQSFRSIKYFNLDISIQQYLNNKKMVKKKIIDFNKFKYEPISLQSCQLIYERVNKQLIDKQLIDNELNDNLIKIMNNLPTIYRQAERTCCTQIRSNGYFSYIKVVFKFLECIEQQLQSIKCNDKFKRDLNYFTKTSHLLNRLTEIQTKLANLTFLDDDNARKNLDNELESKYPQFHRELLMFRDIKLNRKKQLNGLQLNGLQLNNNLIDDDQFEFNSLPLFTPNLDFILESITEAIEQPNTKDKYVIYQDYFMYWLDESLVSFFKFYVFVLPFLRVRLYEYFHLIFSSKFRAQTLNKILSYPTVNFPFEMWNFSDFKVSLLFVKYKTRNTKTKSKEVFIPTQTSIKINSSYENKITFNDYDQIQFTKQRKIRCKYIRPKNYDLINSNKLCVHMHGGGFFSQKCDSHEIYLRHWVNFNKIPILTIDYKTKEAFPNGLQDCFDVYVWLRNAPENEIRRKLGFYPTNIVLTGDSAGGNLSHGVALILNDLRTEFKSDFNVPIQMPNGLVLIYSPFLINTSVSPSRVLAPLDTLVPLGVQLIILYGISGKIPNLKPNNNWQAMMSYLFPNHDPLPWFECNAEQFKERSDELSKLITSPYLTPLFYSKYNQFTDVPLHLISAEFCSFLDESITMAKLWKGECKVDVVESMSHGFLNLKFAGKSVSNATMFCCQKITEMFEYAEKNN